MKLKGLSNECVLRECYEEEEEEPDQMLRNETHRIADAREAKGAAARNRSKISRADAAF